MLPILPALTAAQAAAQIAALADYETLNYSLDTDIESNYRVTKTPTGYIWTIGNTSIFEAAGVQQGKTYQALLSQTGQEAPTVVSRGTGANTPFINTLGANITFSRIAQGVYRLTADAAIFPINPNFLKTAFFAAIGREFNSHIFSIQGFVINGYVVADNIIEFNVISNLDDTYQDDGMNETFIQINLYP